MSKYAGLFKSAPLEAPVEPEPTVEAQAIAPQPSVTVQPQSSTSKRRKTKGDLTDARTGERANKTGKSSNPNYKQTTIYLHKSVVLGLQRAILDESMAGNTIDQTSVIQMLLVEWLSSKGIKVKID